MKLDTYQTLAATDVADALPNGQAMSYDIQSLWQPCPKLMGPAFTVECKSGSNAALHAAIYQAPPGSVIVVKVDANNYAVAGGNVCATAQHNGIAGMIIDGVVRDIAEIRESKFPVFARGIFPKPGNKVATGDRQIPISCGDITVAPNDIMFADEQGIVAVPHQQAAAILHEAMEKKQHSEATPIEQWRIKHRQTIEALFDEKFE